MMQKILVFDAQDEQVDESASTTAPTGPPWPKSFEGQEGFNPCGNATVNLWALGSLHSVSLPMK